MFIFLYEELQAHVMLCQIPLDMHTVTTNIVRHSLLLLHNSIQNRKYCCVATSQCSHINHLRRNHTKFAVNIKGVGVAVPKSGAIFNYGYTCNNNIICNPYICIIIIICITDFTIVA